MTGLINTVPEFSAADNKARRIKEGNLRALFHRREGEDLAVS
jgi:hypothetical protein